MASESQEGEGPVGSLLLTVSAFEPQQFGAEHGIVHSGEHRLTVGQRVGLCDIGGSEFTGRFFQVNLVEHAVPVVACQERPYLGPVFHPLCLKPEQVRLIAYAVGTDTPRHIPEHASTLLIGFIEHPAQHESGIVHVVHHRKNLGRLHIGSAFDV